MNILITNDDGIDCIGIKALANTFKQLGNVFVVAPDSQRSCQSHSMSIKGKIQVEKIDYIDGIQAYKCYGTPVDCIRIGVRCLMNNKPDLVVTGINNCSNIGSDIIYSATIAGAREANILGIPALATAIHKNIDKYYEPCSKLALDVAKKLLNDPLNKEYFLSLNYPVVDDVQKLLICDKMSFRDYDENYKLEKIDGLDYVTINETTINDIYDKNDYGYELTGIYNNHPTLIAYKLNQGYDSIKNHLEDIYKK